MSNSPTPSFSYLSPGQKLGKYEIKRLLGRGGMAEVYQALNPDLNQDVAIKVLHPHIVDSESVILRFRREGAGLCPPEPSQYLWGFEFYYRENDFFMVM